MENELYHHGIKGMKWGVRRYQNSDGSLTAAGKKRYDRDIRENDARKKENRIKIDGPDADRWVKEDLRRSKATIDGASSMINQAGRMLDKNYKKKQSKIDLSNMTDKQLRDRINRYNLEKQYIDMFAPETESKGRRYAKAVLETAGTVLAVGSSALGIALSIKELKG